MIDASIPLTSIEWEEWGNPNVKEYFDYMIEYSPMNNLHAGARYPSCLLLSGLFDPRVQIEHSDKQCSNIRRKLLVVVLVTRVCGIGNRRATRGDRVVARATVEKSLRHDVDLRVLVNSSLYHQNHSNIESECCYYDSSSSFPGKKTPVLLSCHAQSNDRSPPTHSQLWMTWTA
jgi:hypothetical protein